MKSKIPIVTVDAIINSVKFYFEEIVSDFIVINLIENSGGTQNLGKSHIVNTLRNL